MLLELLDGSYELESEHVSKSSLLDAMQREEAQAAVSVPFTLQTVHNWQHGPAACLPMSWDQIADVLQVRSCLHASLELVDKLVLPSLIFSELVNTYAACAKVA